MIKIILKSILYLACIFIGSRMGKLYYSYQTWDKNFDRYADAFAWGEAYGDDPLKAERIED